MSLRAFHIFFIAMSVVITLGFAAWAFSGASPQPSDSLFAMAIGSGVLGAGLIVYGIYFIRKSRHIII